MKTLASLTATAVLTLVAMDAAQSADLQDRTKSLTVSFADLDLSKPEGAATLLDRMRNAAKGVCSSLDGASIREQQRHAACIEFALSNAVTRVDQPTLTEYFAMHTSTQSQLPIKVASGR